MFFMSISLCFTTERFMSLVEIWNRRPLIDYEEINIIRYEKWTISLQIKDLEARLSMSCDFCGGYLIIVAIVRSNS